MKFTTNKRINSSLLGERLIKLYSYDNETGESNDGMRRSFHYTVDCKVYGNIGNEVKNEDGTYTYDYSSRLEKNYDQYGDGVRKPNESERDLKEMIDELMFTYGIHEFMTEFQEKINSIKNYYAQLHININFKNGEFPYIGTQYRVELKDKNYENYTGNDIKTNSIRDMEKQLSDRISKTDYVFFLMNEKVQKSFDVMLGLDEIKDDESVKDFVNKLLITYPKFMTFEEALETNRISIDDIRNAISCGYKLEATNISIDILKKIFEEEPELIKKFKEESIPIELLREYSPNFDITKITPNKLISNDLDKVLNDIVGYNYIRTTWLGIPSTELEEAYIKYLESFYGDVVSLKKIIPAMVTSQQPFFRKTVKEYIENISNEVLSESEKRDIILDAEGLLVQDALEYDLQYDENSARKLMEALKHNSKCINLQNVNSLITIFRQFQISDKEILNTLRINGFDFQMRDEKQDLEDAQKFKDFCLEGLTLDDFRDSMLKHKNFNYIRLIEPISDKDVTRLYNNILNELAQQRIYKREDDPDRYEELFELMSEYKNVFEMFTRLSPEVKALTKQLAIEKLDVVDTRMKIPFAKSEKFNRIMDALSKSFELTMKDLIEIYMKCINSGVNKSDAIYNLKRYLPKEEEKHFEEEIEKCNIYPNPKYFWPTSKKLIRIRLKNAEDRNTIKRKIQADARCFSIKIKTDMVGTSKEGKQIPVNNLSKWLFGVPGARGNLTTTRSGYDIQLPPNTPAEAVKLIEEILAQKEKDEKDR